MKQTVRKSIQPLSIPVRKENERKEEAAYLWIIGGLAVALWIGVFVIALLKLRGVI